MVIVLLLLMLTCITRPSMFDVLASALSKELCQAPTEASRELVAGARRASEGLVTLVAVNGLSFRGEFTVAQYSKQPHRLEVLGCWEYSDFRLLFPELDGGTFSQSRVPSQPLVFTVFVWGGGLAHGLAFWGGGEGGRGSVARVCFMSSC